MDLFDYKNFPNIKNLSFSDLRSIIKELADRITIYSRMEYFNEMPDDCIDIARDYNDNLLDITLSNNKHINKFEYRFRELPLNSELIIYKSSFDKLKFDFFWERFKELSYYISLIELLENSFEDKLFSLLDTESKAFEKPRVYELYKEIYEAIKKENPELIDSDIYKIIAEKTGKSFSAIKLAFYRKTKENPNIK